MENDLKFCPFCGGKAKTVMLMTDYGTWNIVRCTQCRASTGEVLTEEEAIKAWNRRAGRLWQMTL